MTILPSASGHVSSLSVTICKRILSPMTTEWKFAEDRSMLGSAFSMKMSSLKSGMSMQLFHLSSIPK